MEKNKPIDEVKNGRVKAAIWENPTEDGASYSVTMGRLYHDGKSWQTSNSLNYADLLPAALTLVLSFLKVQELRAKTEG